jgi:tetratricopeptide (TPR) repeat protein
VVINGGGDNMRGVSGRAVAEEGNPGDQHRRTVERLRSAIASEPHNPELLIRYAELLYSLADYAAAGQAVYSALGIVPVDERAMKLYARVLFSQGRLGEAVAMAEMAANAYARSADAQFLYAWMLAACRRDAAAVWAIDRAIRCNRNVVDYWLLRAELSIGSSVRPERYRTMKLYCGWIPTTVGQRTIWRSVGRSSSGSPRPFTGWCGHIS